MAAGAQDVAAATGRVGNITGTFGLLLLLLFTTTCCCCCCITGTSCCCCGVAGCWTCCCGGAGAGCCCCCGGACCCCLAPGLLAPAARLAKAAGGRLITARSGLAGLFLARHSSQLAISGSFRSPCTREKVNISRGNTFGEFVTILTSVPDPSDPYVFCLLDPDPSDPYVFCLLDPDPSDPYVFVPPGSGSISQRHGSVSVSFYQPSKNRKKTLIPTVLLLHFDFLSLKKDVNVPSKSNMKKNFF